MDTITETRSIALPHMPDIAAIITPADDQGKRAKLVNICADDSANIIRVMEWMRDRC